MPHDIETLADRVRSMEREVRLHRRAALAVLGAIALAVAARPAGSAPRSAPPAAEVRARRIVLVGAGGQELAVLGAGAGQGARLELSGPSGQARITLDASGGAPGLFLDGPDGRRRIALEAGADLARVAVLGLGRTQAALANDGEAPRLVVSDAVGTDRAWLAVRLGSPVLQFLDAQGVARTGLSTFNDDTGAAVVSKGGDGSKPGLVLMGKDGRILWSAP